MKLTTFALVLAIVVGFSVYATDESAVTHFEGVIQQLPAGSLLGVWMVSQKAVIVTGATKLEEEDGPIRVGANVDIRGFLQPDGSIMAANIETDE
jgi:hypothetical protein